MAEQKAHTYSQTHTLRKDMLQFNLMDEYEGVKMEAAAASGGTSGKTLVKAGLLRIAIVALEKGDDLDHHEMTGPCSIQVLRGRVRVPLPSGDVEIGEGGLVALDSGTEHGVVAMEDSGILVTVAMG